MTIQKIWLSGQREKIFAYDNISRKSKYILMILTMIVLLICSYYLHFEWRKYQEIASSEAVQLAQSLETLLHPTHIKDLSGSAEDVEDPKYTVVKNSLIRLVNTTNPIRFAYLIANRNGKLIILMDSESPGSPDYSPPGQLYEETKDIYFEPFITGNTTLTLPTTDRWGTWISVLVPIKDPESGEIIAIFGIDYSASEWYAALWRQMIPDFTVAIVILMLYCSLLYIWGQRFRLRSLNRKLTINEALYRSVYEQAPIGIAIVYDKSFASNSEFGYININPMFEQILGRTSNELAVIKWPEITYPDDLQADLKNFNQFKKGEINGYTMEKRFVKPDGSVVWTIMKISPLQGLDRNYSMHLCLLEDISERKRTETALQESERRETVLLSHLPGLAYRCKYDHDGTMLIVSEGCYKLTGYLPEFFINNRDLTFNSIITPEYRELLLKEWERTIPNRQPYSCEYEITTATGKRKWVIEMGQGVFNEQGEVEALEGIILDISDRKEMENNLRYINEHDRWTGLYNRDYLEVLLDNDAKKADGLKRALIGINLSTIQLLTANYGFHYTQNFIKQIAETLIRHSSDKRRLFQTHENRFVFYLINYENKNDLIDFTRVISDALESLFVTDRIGGGIGILEIDPESENNADLLLKRLLIASERSMTILGKDFRACFYDEDVETLENREAEIRQALSRIAVDDTSDELFLVYQPILGLSTNSISGFEALARMKTQKLGSVSPAEFIPIAEKTKLIIPIGEKVILKAFHFLNKLKENGIENIPVSINVSVIQLLRPDFITRLFEIISDMHVNPRNIGIEITESVFALDYESINNIIRKLKDAGLQIAIDDFGTGYSSLAREKKLNVTCLKIDKYFIDKLSEVNSDKAITGDIISMAHKLGHCAIAEGVEYESQLQYLREHGCDKVQGYIFSKPLDEDAALEFVRKEQIMSNGCLINDCPHKGC